ncbi:hypothetical protein [Crassaminicella profunda]|uniref:hypothetical protein n=1 Tax=Crassaminicella profunda TaxID=1286698 RepID=UPI001CA72B43|nr:hypothetical protein [Crassaminicella profunda]QZY57143.1 hypothetical protein K7H06_09580 [Crassaminicella profunda]
MFIYLRVLLLMLLIVSILGYIFTILKEKYYLWNNTIFIENKVVSQVHMDEIESKHFKIGSIEVMAGDEMKIHFYDHPTVKGIILGAKIQDNSVWVVTAKKQVHSVSVKDIKKIKIVSRYGKFFNVF